MKFSPDDIINFWFEEIDQKSWFEKNHGFDALVIEKFSKLHDIAARDELWQWRETPEGALAEIIILDQFSRNMFRGNEKSFETDMVALALAQEAVAEGKDKHLSGDKKAFLYMPYMHSESKLVHEEAVKLFNQPDLENYYKFELMHKEIIDRFNRYPHRNETLDRQSTKDELEFLKQEGSSF